MGNSITEIVAKAEMGPINLFGATRSVSAVIAQAWSEDAPLVVVTPSEEEANSFAEDLRSFANNKDEVLWLPAPDSHPYARISADRFVAATRQSGLFRLVDPNTKPRIVVLSAHSLTRKTMPPNALFSLGLKVEKGATLDRDDFIERISKAGFTRNSIVEDVGSFAVRGGIIDIFVGLEPYPIRVEFFGDEIETIRLFDPQSQRTLRELHEFQLCPVRDTILSKPDSPRSAILEAADTVSQPSKLTRQLLDTLEDGHEFVGIESITPAFHERMVSAGEYLPKDTRLIVIEPETVERECLDAWEQAERSYQAQVEAQSIAFPISNFFSSPEELASLLAIEKRIEFRRLEIQNEYSVETETVRIRSATHTELSQKLESARKNSMGSPMEALTEALDRWETQQTRIAIACASSTRRQRLRGLFAENEIPLVVRDNQPLSWDDIEPGGPTALFSLPFSEGFELTNEGLVLLTESDIFGQSRRISERQRAAARRARAALTGSVGDFSQLNEGDLLVHQLHGVGQYVGLKKLPMQGDSIDFLHLEYVGGTLYLPVYRLGEVERYVGSEGQKPKLDKLGGVTWERRRKKVQAHVQALAEELLQIYAQRAARPGYGFPPRDAMFTEFESSFSFEETPDQDTAIEKIMEDMEKQSPMDRLVCGDVGYGKTEVALRALFKAACGGKQAALLAPTTVLVEQHYQTMSERFANWPVTIAKLSRFQSAKVQKETVAKLADGSVDIVVGTHRLLSKDIRFRDLGLLVIDEEQRFGVAHKEKLKRARTQMDVLTLTATPIPRTLHMAMSGLRDLSIIATPPADRRSIRTFISRPEDATILEGVKRELAREGQIFFVVPRIESTRGKSSLLGWTEKLRKLVPNARVESAHGQMRSDELEKVMVAFVAGKIDILVSTTIVESGLDIPRANTMFVADADHFGVSQLYQLRGRIGRSKERAYCYLLVPPSAKLSSEAKKRLEVLQRHSDLGAGFMIASHDLEIRGAGELLGAKQSGSIAAVGFDSYTRMLDEAIAELRGEEIFQAKDPELNVEDPGFIPDDYVSDVGQRLDLYKRLSNAKDADEIATLQTEMADRYGAVPEETKRLGDLMVLKGMARDLRIQSIELTSKKLALALYSETPVDASKLAQFIQSSTSALSFTRDQRILISFGLDEQIDPIGAAQNWLQTIKSQTCSKKQQATH